MTTKNIETVQQIYADFGAGNLQGIMDRVDESVSWNDPGYPDLPFGSLDRKKNQIPDFFKSLAGSLEYSAFEPREFYADGNSVTVLGYHAGKTIPSGHTFGHDWVMIWKFTDAGKVNYYRAFIDTNDIAKGFKK